MSTDIVKASVGADVTLHYPDGLPVPIILGLVVSAAEELFIAGHRVSTAWAEIRNETNIVIRFYEERSRIICEDYIPVTATWAAYQWGKRMIKQLRLPPEDQQEAYNDLAKTLQKTRLML